MIYYIGTTVLRTRLSLKYTLFGLKCTFSGRHVPACLVLSLVTLARVAYVNGKNVYGQGLFVMDYETGTELYSYNADTLFVPTSITKPMSMYLTYEAVKKR